MHTLYFGSFYKNNFELLNKKCVSRNNLNRKLFICSKQKIKLLNVFFNYNYLILSMTDIFFYQFYLLC